MPSRESVGLRLVVSNDGFLIHREVHRDFSLAFVKDPYKSPWEDLTMRWMNPMIYTATAEGAKIRREIVQGTAQAAALALEAIADNADETARVMGADPYNPTAFMLGCYSLALRANADLLRSNAQRMVESSQQLGHRLYGMPIPQNGPERG